MPFCSSTLSFVSPHYTFLPKKNTFPNPGQDVVCCELSASLAYYVLERMCPAGLSACPGLSKKVCLTGPLSEPRYLPTITTSDDTWHLETKASDSFLAGILH